MATVESSTGITPLLMFEGQAEAAMERYTMLFEDSEIVDLRRYGPDDGGREGTVERATFVLAGASFMAIDSPPVHDFTFTPAISLFVDCDAPAEVDRLYEALSEDGEVLMPLDGYEFSDRFAWVEDEFGVSWQLSAE